MTTSRRTTATVTALALATCLGGATHAVRANQECLDERKQRVGHALGVVFAERVLRHYEGRIDVDAVGAGMRQRLNEIRRESPGELDLLPGVSADSNGDRTLRLTLEQAEDELRGWSRDTADVGARYARAFAAHRDIEPTASGLLFVKAEADSPYMKVMETCFEEATEAKRDDEGLEICYFREKITEKLLCAMEQDTPTKVRGKPVAASFTADEVIEGWAELFGLVRGEGPIDEGDVLELVIPPTLAYGAKGVPGEVESDETLRFVIQLGREVESPAERTAEGPE